MLPEKLFGLLFKIGWIVLLAGDPFVPVAKELGS